MTTTSLNWRRLKSIINGLFNCIKNLTLAILDPSSFNFFFFIQRKNNFWKNNKMFEFASLDLPVYKLYNGAGGIRRGANFTLSCAQHIWNSGWSMFDDETRSSIQWRALQCGHWIFIKPKLFGCRLSFTGRRAIQKDDECATIAVNIQKKFDEIFDTTYFDLQYQYVC